MLNSMAQSEGARLTSDRVIDPYLGVTSSARALVVKYCKEFMYQSMG